MIMERAGSSDRTSMNYQCAACGYSVRVPLGRPGDRQYEQRIPCPRCVANGPPQPRVVRTPEGDKTGA